MRDGCATHHDRSGWPACAPDRQAGHQPALVLKDGQRRVATADHTSSSWAPRTMARAWSCIAAGIPARATSSSSSASASGRPAHAQDRRILSWAVAGGLPGPIRSGRNVVRLGPGPRTLLGTREVTALLAVHAAAPPVSRPPLSWRALRRGRRWSAAASRLEARRAVQPAGADLKCHP